MKCVGTLTESHRPSCVPTRVPFRQTPSRFKVCRKRRIADDDCQEANTKPERHSLPRSQPSLLFCRPRSWRIKHRKDRTDATLVGHMPSKAHDADHPDDNAHVSWIYRTNRCRRCPPLLPSDVDSVSHRTEPKHLRRYSCCIDSCCSTAAAAENRAQPKGGGRLGLSRTVSHCR